MTTSNCVTNWTTNYGEPAKLVTVPENRIQVAMQLLVSMMNERKYAYYPTRVTGNEDRTISFHWFTQHNQDKMLVVTVRPQVIVGEFTDKIDGVVHKENMPYIFDEHEDFYMIAMDLSWLIAKMDEVCAWMNKYDIALGTTERV